MFATRKNQEEFEWHRYVRTSIKLRREQRRQRILEARRAAASQVGAAGEALIVGSKAAGAAARDGARAGIWAFGLVLQGAWHLLAAVVEATARKLWIAAQPLLAVLARPQLGIPVALAGAVLVGCAVGRYRAGGLDGEAVLTLAAGSILLSAVLPLLSGLTGLALPRLPVGRARRLGALTVFGVGLLAAGAYWHSGAMLAGLGSTLPHIGGARSLSGRAEAIAGDRLRLAGRSLRLDGIEAPDPQQRCGGGGRGWRCGPAAQAALSRLIKGRLISCTLRGNDAGLALATCRSGDSDIAAELVKEGHVFAEGGLFSSYASLEAQARDAHLGIWGGGAIERPGEYRARLARKPRADARGS
jgi:endonuclease YncB( thermonuclease family)